MLRRHLHRTRRQFLSLNKWKLRIVFWGGALTIMYSLRRIAPFCGKDMTRSLILAGGAAGVAAAFNTPLAGIMFAVEEMSRFTRPWPRPICKRQPTS